MDIDFLQRRIELLHNDNQSNREDIARMTNETFKKILTINKQTNKYFIVNQDDPKNRKIIINLLQ
jgi:hypothetical protein